MRRSSNAYANRRNRSSTPSIKSIPSAARPWSANFISWASPHSIPSRPSRGRAWRNYSTRWSPCCRRREPRRPPPRRCPRSPSWAARTSANRRCSTRWPARSECWWMRRRAPPAMRSMKWWSTRAGPICLSTPRASAGGARSTRAWSATAWRGPWTPWSGATWRCWSSTGGKESSIRRPSWRGRSSTPAKGWCC